MYQVKDPKNGGYIFLRNVGVHFQDKKSQPEGLGDKRFCSRVH